MAALLYLLAAAAAVALLRLRTLVAVALVLLPLLITGRAILTGDVYAPVDIAMTAEPLASIAAEAGITSVANPGRSDVYAQFIPWRDAVRFAVRHGQWPLWNPFEFCGDPLAGAVQSAPYHPIHLLALLLPLADDLTFTATATLFLAALAAFLFLRELTENEPAALFGAAAWMLAAHLITFLGTAHGMSIAALPLLLVGARRVARQPGRRSATRLLLALLLLVLAGHPESMLHCVTLAAVYFFFQRPSRRAIAWGLGCGIAALLLSAVFLLPFFEALPQTAELRSRKASDDAPRSTLPEVARELAADALPYIELPAGSHTRVGAAYAGALLFAPALVALFTWRDRERWFFAALLIWGLLAGANAPGVADLLAGLPGFSIAVNDRMVVFAALALVVLATNGLRASHPPAAARLVPRDARPGETPAGWRGHPRAFFAVAAVLAAAAMLHGGDVRVAAARQVVPLLLAGGVVLVFRAPRITIPLLLALLLIERSGELGRQPIVPRRALYPPFAGLELLPRDEVYRVVGAGPLLTPNIATHYRLEDVRGYQAMTFGRLADTFPLWSTPQSVWSNRVDDLGAPMLSLMNVRFALAPPRTPLPAGWVARHESESYMIAENLRALPRAFVPATAHVETPERVLEAMRGARDFAAEGWVEKGAGGPNGPGVVSARRDGTRLRLHASMQNDGWVIISESAWKGWRATIDGKRAKVRRGDYAFLALRVPRGEHDVELFYRPRAFVIGAWISVMSALLVGIIGFRARS
jgi:hypothetical protein